MSMPVRLLNLFLITILVFSCSSKPVDFYPNRKPPTNSKNNTTQSSSPTYTTETIVDAPLKSSSNPYGSVSRPIENEETSGSKPAIASPHTNSSADWLSYLKTQTERKKISEDIIINRLSSSQLENASKDPMLTGYKPLILWQLAQLYFKNKRPSQAIDNFRKLSNEFPNHHLTTQAKSTLILLEAAEDVDSSTIGVILPLTGKNASVGQHTLNSIRIALGLNKPDPKFKLAVFDTQSLPDTSAGGFDKLLIDDKPIAIIGGLSAKEATLIAQKSDLFSVPFMALTQKPDLTDIGDFVFRNALTPEMQVSELVDYSFNKLGARKFAILYPNDSYGVEFANSFWDQVLARGGQITAAQTYDAKENNFTMPIQKMVGTYYPESRPEEYALRLEELKKIKAERNKKLKKPVIKNSRENEVEESILQPVVDFDVLFIPDSGRVLSQVMAFMKVAEVGSLTYLGTNIWNSPDIIKRTLGAKDRIYFVDAVNSNDTSIRENQFFKDYLAEYNEEPSLIEMQAYEVAKIISDLIANGSRSRDSLASRLRSLGRTQGVTGELRMSNYREIERPVYVFGLESGLLNKVN